MARVVHFELPMDNAERATKFYSDVFGWQFQKWDGPQPYWMVKTGDGAGIDGGMMMRPPSGAPGATTVNTIDVPSVDEYSKKVVDAGGTVLMPKMPVGEMGFIAYCADTEGTPIGIWETAPKA